MTQATADFNPEFEARMKRLYVDRMTNMENVQPGYWADIRDHAVKFVASQKTRAASNTARGTIQLAYRGDIRAHGHHYIQDGIQVKNDFTFLNVCRTFKRRIANLFN